MSPHKLLLKVADWVEKHPDRYEFWCPCIPERAKDKGCLLGWIVYFGKLHRADLGVNYLDGGARFVGFQWQDDFYAALSAIPEREDWRASGKAAAWVLRKLVKAQEKDAKKKAA